MCLINMVAPAAANGAGYTGYEIGTAYGAPACQGPAYCGPLVPGCCDYPPSCRCDDIWAGYCQEKNQGCGWPVLSLPVIRCRGGFSARYGVPQRAPSRCMQTVVPACNEPVCDQFPVAPAGKSATPAPAIRTVPKAPAVKTRPSQAPATKTPAIAPVKLTPPVKTPAITPAKLTPPAKPQPSEEIKKSSSTRKSSGAWRFLPAVRSATR